MERSALHSRNDIVSLDALVNFYIVFSKGNKTCVSFS